MSHFEKLKGKKNHFYYVLKIIDFHHCIIPLDTLIDLILQQVNSHTYNYKRNAQQKSLIKVKFLANEKENNPN